jgi:hypothetical protein
LRKGNVLLGGAVCQQISAGILEHHSDALPAQPKQLSLRNRANVNVADEHPSGRRPQQAGE